MSNRSQRKVRHFKPSPSVKERVQAGMLKQTDALWAKYGWGKTEAVVPAVPVEHVHSEDCQHDHS
jgi:hypothetical protein